MDPSKKIEFSNGKLKLIGEDEDMVLLIRLYLRDVQSDFDVRSEIEAMTSESLIFCHAHLTYEGEVTIDQVITIVGEFKSVEPIQFHKIANCYGLIVQTYKKLPSYTRIRKLTERLADEVKLNSYHMSTSEIHSIRMKVTANLKYELNQLETKLRRGRVRDIEESKLKIESLKSEIDNIKIIHDRMKMVKPRNSNSKLVKYTIKIDPL
jgi:hypothetical protein